MLSFDFKGIEFSDGQTEYVSPNVPVVKILLQIDYRALEPWELNLHEY